MLRLRLFLNLVPFLVILAAIGGYAVVLFSRLTKNVETTITQHHESLISLEKMGDALTRMDTQILLALARRTDNPGPAFAIHDAAFSENLNRELESPVLPRTALLVQRLEANHQAFQRAAAAILAGPGLAQQVESYEQRLLPAKLVAEELLSECRRIHHEAILATTLDIQASGERMRFWMMAGLLVALLLSGYACFQFARSILGPIRELTRATRQLAEDKLDRPVPVVSRDELGELAGAFNKMAAQLQAYRQSTSEQILQLHRTMEAMLASFPDPILVFKPEGQIDLVNPAAEELLSRLRPAGQLPAPLHELIHDARSAGKNFLPQEFKAAFVLSIGSEDRHFLPRIVVMRHQSNGVMLGVALVLYDITRFRLMDDVKTNLVATVSHELKTPLTSVRMVLHMLLENALGPLMPRQHDLLRTACIDAERLLRILNNLLDLARLEQGSTALQLEAVLPPELVRMAAEEANESAVSRGLTLSWQADEDLPSVSVDRQRIGHVFSNFITNAIKYSPAGAQIRLRASRAEDGGVEFSVQDQGPGVLDEYRSRIFDRFFRVPGQERRGAGLGLSIAREIVLAHGGHIGVRSASGQGSEFFFVLSPECRAASAEAGG